MPNRLQIEGQASLHRRLSLPLLVLYGVGITVGAGIYVLIGAVVGHAGIYAPWSFALAAFVMAFTVGSYAELCTRFPVSAGEAAYVREAFHSRPLSVLTGLITIGIGAVSSSAVALGSAGYIQQFIDLPQNLIAVIVVLVLGVVAAWGILESVLLASLFTVIEVGGLVAIIAAGIYADVPATISLQPPLEIEALSGIAYASLLAFFAFIGFEDLANAVEEAKVPHRDIPRAMVLTLIISTFLYIAVAATAVGAVSVERLSTAPAPLSLVFRELAGISPMTISAIAIVATLNTILAQMTMAARVIYGMARGGDLPRAAGHVNPRTGTPLLATCLVAVVVIALALSVPFEWLAESTSLATLSVFGLINLALLTIHVQRANVHRHHLRVPIWVPAAGFISCVAMIASALLR
ncbi:APC family permease [Mesorhizobium sp. KR9-304]|uniref:APC family permease n=1 Tax=Mesorhizobium sp. KR9-304 TaxID=3156614 RepID=UPI0032B32108